MEFFDDCGYKCPPRTNPSDFFLDIMATDTLEGESQADAMGRVQKLQQSCIIEKPKELSGINYPPLEMKAVWNNSFLAELGILLRRSFSQELRDKATIGATFGQSFVNIFLLGFVFWRIPLDSKGMPSPADANANPIKL